MLNVGTEFRKGILFVRLRGELNKNTIYKLDKRVTKIVKENGIRNIVFNLKNLKTIDIKGIHSLFYNYEIIRNNEGVSLLCNPNDNVKQKLKSSRLINYMYEIPDEISAIKILNIR